MQLTMLKYAHFGHERTVSNKQLRQQVKECYGMAVRRLDNFTLCGLAAVAELGDAIEPFESLSLISCAQYFSIELVQQMLIDMQQSKAIRPLDFVATVGNAANFYIAKEFAIEGSNLFIGADQHTLSKSCTLASLEVKDNHKDAVVLLIWQETEERRLCHALIVRKTQESDIQLPALSIPSNITDLNSSHTPLVLEFNP